MQRLGFKPEQYFNPDFSLLEALGFSDEEIDAANDYVCGTMTVEGAPFLKDEHLSVFDCANKCGKKGERLYTCTWPHTHDGRCAAIHQRCNFQDHQPAK